MRRLGLSPVQLPTDTRSAFFGHPVDHIFVRGLETVLATAPQVSSSDHNPVVATLRVVSPVRFDKRRELR
jgi:endonuclease/exonuclease/phosphatase (EEP) superfamily protein YafD